MMTQVRTFRAPTVREALAQVKKALGPDAVILGTRTISSGPLGALVGKTAVEITAAPPETPTRAPRLGGTGPAGGRRVSVQQRAGSSAAGKRDRPGAGPPVIGQPNPLEVPGELYPYYLKLVQNEVAAELAAELIRQAVAVEPNAQRRPEALRRAMREAIARLVPLAGGVELPHGEMRRVALVGPPGAGKTSTAAKLAAHFKLRERRRVGVLSIDMHRMATHAELGRYAKLIGVPFETAQTVTGLRDARRRLEGVELVLIDTPGVSWRDRGRFVRLAALLRSADAHEVHLVLPASMSSEVQRRCAEQFAPLGVSRVALTRVDELIGCGAVLNAMSRLSWGLSYLCDGQTVPSHLQEACSERLAELVLPRS